MPIGAALEELELSSPQVRELAEFYAKSFSLHRSFRGANALCTAPGRTLKLVPGDANRLVGAQFRFSSRPDFDAFTEHLSASGISVAEKTGGVSVTDPEGHILRVRYGTDQNPANGDARLQHFALRTPDPETLVAFYADKLGFIVSDFVRDEEGVLRAAFLRTDDEHHALAIFRSAEARFDHFSCEVESWTELRDWADRICANGITLAWGVGRHGPGNDTFFMVKDPDGNLAEISAELERCAPERATGLWPHRPETLNRWGVAIMRS